MVATMNNGSHTTLRKKANIDKTNKKTKQNQV